MNPKIIRTLRIRPLLLGLATLATLGTALIPALLPAAQAQTTTWPGARPVTLLVPYPPGGSSDLIARAISARLADAVGSGTFVVENKGGAGGTIGTALVKQAAPDGHTVLVTSLGPLVIGPHLMKNIAYDPLRDFDYVTLAVQAPNVLTVPAGSALKSVADVLSALKAKPGGLTFASGGNGSSDHLTAELFWQVTQTQGTHVPYKGGAPALQDLIGGQVDTTFMNINTGLPHIQAGKLRALAVTSRTRAPQLPEVPTLDELGLKGLNVQSWQGVALPRGTPPEIRNRLHAAIRQVLQDPAVRATLEQLGFEIVANDPAAFTAFQAREFDRWKQVIESGRIMAQ